MRLPIHHWPIVRAAAAALLLSLCLSCASLMPGFGGIMRDHRTIFAIQHSHSAKPSDCLAVCTDMVLKYYGVEAMVPDTGLPLDLISLSHRLNADTAEDKDGHVLFAAALELTPPEVVAQLAKQRPLIVAFQPSPRKAYHSIVLSGYSTDFKRLHINDPARRKASWTKLSRIPTFEDSGKYLVLLIGLREK